MRNSLRPLRNEEAFTLVEIMISGAILLGLALVLTQMSTLSQRIMVTSETRFEIQDDLSNITDILRNPNSCKESFKTLTPLALDLDPKNKNLVDANTLDQALKQPASSQMIQVLKRYYLDSTGTPQLALSFPVQDDAPLSGATPDKVAIIGMVLSRDKGPTNGKAVLHVRFKKLRGGIALSGMGGQRAGIAMGGDYVDKTIPLYDVVFDASNSIKACQAGSTPTDGKAFCATIANSTWDDLNSKCNVAPSGAGSAPIIGPTAYRGLDKYNPSDGTEFCANAAAYSGHIFAGTLVLTNPSTTAPKSFLIIGQVSVGNDNKGDYVAYLLEWFPSGVTPKPGYNGKIVAMNQQYTDYSPGDPKYPALNSGFPDNRPTLIQITTIETLGPGETRTYANDIKDTFGGCAVVYGGKIMAAPLN